MDSQTAKEIFTEAARSIVTKQYDYFVLDISRLSEPEARHVVTKVLDEKHIYYSLEYPTVEKHKLTGKTISRSALVDLVLFEKGRKEEPAIWIEFKRAQSRI